MSFLLELPVWLGILVIILIISITSLFIVTQIKKRIGSKITKQHEKVGRLLFRVSAGLIALLLSLSYANERIEQNKIIDSMELEASLVVNVVMKLKLYDTEESEIINKKLMDYVSLTINDDWSITKANPYFSTASKSIHEAYKLAYKLSDTNQNQTSLKISILNELNQIIKLMQVRIYSQKTYTPQLIYILLIGLFFMWIFFTVYKLDIISLSFLTLYNTFVAILIYFIFMLSNPLVGKLKIDHYSFSIIMDHGLNKVKNNQN